LPILILNLLVLPASIFEGAHYLVDIVAGILIASGSIWLSSRLVLPRTAKPDLRD
jgi:membrane-associated phospholipid phosphatase